MSWIKKLVNGKNEDNFGWMSTPWDSDDVVEVCTKDQQHIKITSADN